MRHAVCYFYPRPLLGLSGHGCFLQRYPKKANFQNISFVHDLARMMEGIEIIGVCVKCTSFPSLPLLRL